MPKYPRDRIDEVSRHLGRVGAHRAEQPRFLRWSTFLWAFVAVVILVVGGIFGAMVVTGQIEFGDRSSEEAPPADEPPAELDVTYGVFILNATPEAGLEQSMRNLLIASGFAEGAVTAGPGAADDFAETTVYYLSESHVEAARGLADLIGGALVEQSDFYADQAEPEAKQLTVVIGRNSTSSADSENPES